MHSTIRLGDSFKYCSSRSCLPFQTSTRNRRTAALRFRAASQQDVSSKQSLSTIVRKQLQDGQYHPYIYQKSLVSSKLLYQNDFHTLKGAKTYIDAATIWFDRQQRLLPEVKTELSSLSQLSPTELILKWRVSWVRPAAAWILQIGRIFPNLKLEYKDILHKVGEESKIGWKGLQKLLTKALQEGVLEVPVAVILGTTRLTFSPKNELNNADDVDAVNAVNGADDLELLRVKESLDLVSRFDDNSVKNRTITRDLLLFLLVRQPPGTATEDWLGTVRQRIDVDAVPGMGMFSVDGQTDSERAQGYEDATAVLAYVTFSVIVVGLVLGYTYMSAIPRF